MTFTGCGRSRFGFTLIELLVVLAIIGVLLAILLAALGHARCVGKRTNCLAKVRELVVAWEHLLNDQGDRFPLAQHLEWTYGGQQGLHFPPQFVAERPLNPYLGLDPILGRFDPPTPRREENRVADCRGQIFRCPSDTGGHESDAAYMSFYGASYQSNPLLVRSSLFVPSAPFDRPFLSYAARRGGSPIRRSRVDVNHTRMMLVGDGGWWLSWLPESIVPRELARVSEWHERKGGHNIGYLDGHAAFQRLAKGVGSAPDYTIMPYAAVDAALQDVQDRAGR